MPARIYIVEDHPIVRHGLASVLEAEGDLTVCGETGSASEARRRILDLRPDLVLLDLFLEDGSGLTLTEELRAQTEDLPILIVSAQDENLYAQRALAAGAQGYLMKSEAYWKIAEAVRQLLDGKIYLSAKMTSALLSAYVRGTPLPTDSPLAALTDRELEVFTLMGKGLERREIADTLSLSPKTIDTYRDHLKKKLSLDSNTQLRRNAAVWIASNGSGIE